MPFTQFLAIGDNANNPAFTTPNIVTIVIQSDTAGQNLTIVTRDIAPVADVDSMDISICLQCPPPPPPPPSPEEVVIPEPAALGSQIGLGVGITLTKIIN